MSGSFSCIVNFTIEQFLKRAGKLSVLTDIEQKSESGQLKCSLKFPKHHKRQHKRDIFKKVLLIYMQIYLQLIIFKKRLIKHLMITYELLRWS